MSFIENLGGPLYCDILAAEQRKLAEQQEGLEESLEVEQSHGDEIKSDSTDGQEQSPLPTVVSASQTIVGGNTGERVKSRFVP